MSRACRLVPPGLDLYDAFLEMSGDYRRAGESRYQQAEGWTLERFERFVAGLADHARGIGLQPGASPVITRWLVDGDGRIAGVVRLRTVLTEELLNEGGNIGYDVPPSRRRQGFGTELLRRALEMARAHGLARVRVTCDADNEPSRRIIERCGGVLAGQGISDDDGTPVLQFWIDLAPPQGDLPSA